MAYPRWAGVFPAMTTQFNRDGSLNLPALEKHLQVVVDSGVTGMVMLGSLGENVAQSPAEKREVLRVARGVLGPQRPLITGVAELNTAAAVGWMQTAADLVDGYMVMPCMAYRADASEAIAHYQITARATDKPIIAYNNPLAYAVDLTPDVMSVLAEEANITTIKESCGDPRRVTDLYNQVGDRFAIFAGVDDLIFEAVTLGATGWIAGAGLAFPRENQRLWDLLMAGEYAAARDLYRWFMPLLHLDVGSKFIHNIKLAIQEVGLGEEWVRMPRLPLTGAEREHVLGTVRRAIETRPTW